VAQITVAVPETHVLSSVWQVGGGYSGSTVTYIPGPGEVLLYESHFVRIENNGTINHTPMNEIYGIVSKETGAWFTSQTGGNRGRYSASAPETNTIQNYINSVYGKAKKWLAPSEPPPARCANCTPNFAPGTRGAIGEIPGWAIATGSPGYVFDLVDIPINADSLAFLFELSAFGGDGDYLSFSLGGWILEDIDLSTMAIGDFIAYEVQIPDEFKGQSVPFGRMLTNHSGNYTEVWSSHLIAAPLPPAAFLFGSGLLGLVSMARRKKTS